MDRTKCAHETCSCQALPLQDYCGEECKTAAELEASGEKAMDRCHCNHPDCGGEPEISPEAAGLLAASELLATP